MTYIGYIASNVYFNEFLCCGDVVRISHGEIDYCITRNRHGWFNRHGDGIAFHTHSEVVL